MRNPIHFLKPSCPLRQTKLLKIMKNLLFVFVALIFVLTSCTKENIEPIEIETIELNAEKETFQPTKSTESNPQALIRPTEILAESTIIRLQVSEINSLETATALEVNFVGNYDFSQFVIEDNQSLKFTNATELGFAIDSYAGSNGTLNVVFAKGGHNLTGLTLALAQEIVIEDLIHN